MIKSPMLKQDNNFKKVIKKLVCKRYNSYSDANKEIFLIGVGEDDFLTNASSFLKVALETHYFSEKEFSLLNKKYRQEKTTIMHSLLKIVLEYALLNLPKFIEISEKKYDIKYSIFKREAGNYNQENYSLFMVEVLDLEFLLKNSIKIQELKKECLEIFYTAFAVNYDQISIILNKCLYGEIYFTKNTFEYFDNEILLYKIENKLIFEKKQNNEYSLTSSKEEMSYSNLKILEIHRNLIKSNLDNYINLNIVNGRSIDKEYKYRLFNEGIIYSFDDYSMFHTNLFLEATEEINDINPEYEINCFFVKGKISSNRFDLIYKELVNKNCLYGLMRFMSGLKRI